MSPKFQTNYLVFMKIEQAADSKTGLFCKFYEGRENQNLNLSCCGRTVALAPSQTTPPLLPLLSLSSVGRRQPADWLSPGQLWGDPSPDHGCLPEGPAQGTDRRGGNFQR